MNRNLLDLSPRSIAGSALVFLIATGVALRLISSPAAIPNETSPTQEAAFQSAGFQANPPVDKAASSATAIGNPEGHASIENAGARFRNGSISGSLDREGSLTPATPLENPTAGRAPISSDVASPQAALAPARLATPEPIRNLQANQAKVPISFVPPDSSLNLTPEQIAGIANLQQKFIDAVGGPNQNSANPDYLRRWQAAQRQNDQEFKQKFGWQTLVVQQLQAGVN